MHNKDLSDLKTINQQVMIDLIGDVKAEIVHFQQQFLRQAKTSLQHIAQLYRQEQFNKIKDEAHFLKTSAKAIGAELCAYHLQTLEYASLAQDKIKCKQHIHNLSNELKQVYLSASG